MGVADYGTAVQTTASPSLADWAASVSAALDDDDTTVDARVATAVSAHTSTVGNLLTDNQASGTDTLGDTTGFTSVAAVITSSTEQVRQGSRSLKIVTTGATGRAVTDLFPVPPGSVVTAQMSVYPVAGITSGVHRLYWYKSDGAPSDTPTSQSDVFPTLGAWNDLSHTFIVPADATQAIQGFLRTGGPDDVMTRYEDRRSVHTGAGGDWAMPGVPITGLGTRITRPNVDDRLVEQWNGAAWSVVDYDSGWRDISGSLSNGWSIAAPTSVNRALTRRTNREVHFMWRNTTTGTTTSGTIIWSMPTGFTETGLFRNQYRPVNASTGAAGTLNLDGDALKVQAWPSSGSVGISTSWVTDDSTPTSLPGTLATAAPA